MVTESAEFRYGRDEVEISRARGEVRRFLVELPSDLVDDLELVVAELVTNAVEHGTGSWIVVELGIDPDVVSIAVTQEGGSDLGDPTSWIMPPMASRTGRGLALVRILVDAVEWSRSDNLIKVRVDRRYGA